MRTREFIYRARNRIDNTIGLSIYFNDYIDRAIKTGAKNLKTRYGEEIFVDNNIIGANEWIKKYDKKYEKRSRTENGLLVEGSSFFIDLPDKNTFAFVQCGDIQKGNENRNISSLSVYIFGKHYKKYVNEFKTVIIGKGRNELFIYDIKGYANGSKEEGVDSVGRPMKGRDIDSLFFNHGIKEEVISHIDGFIKNRDLYESRNLTYKTGILLYGEPGTGKTSFATALATKYNRNVILIDLASFQNLDIATLTSCINADTDKFIVLLEDIDSIFPNLNREADKELSENERKTINKMLQFLDSSSSPNDVIFIATTNHYDKLDKAILRDGRFDIKVEINEIHESIAKDMIKSFNIDDNGVEEIIKEMNKPKSSRSKVVDHKDVNPSELQNKILQYFKNQKKMEVED